MKKTCCPRKKLPRILFTYMQISCDYVKEKKSSNFYTSIFFLPKTILSCQCISTGVGRYAWEWEEGVTGVLHGYNPSDACKCSSTLLYNVVEEEEKNLPCVRFYNDGIVFVNFFVIYNPFLRSFPSRCKKRTPFA